MTQTIRWGILGPGAISQAFARALGEAAGAELVAVGSRDAGRAAQFAADFNIPNVHGSYQALAEDPQVDAVYIGTPHAFHEDHTVLCLDHGKHVLCEKPLAINATQARRMADAARSHDLLLMEAMWTRFLPAIVAVRALLAEGAIGRPRMMAAEFGFAAPYDPDSRLFNPHLGGGALLDLGIYPLSLASMLFGAPVEISSYANLSPTGVDQEAAVQMRHSQGELAQFTVAFTLEARNEAVIWGREGSIRLHAPFWGCERITLRDRAGTEDTRAYPHGGEGFTHEAVAFMDLIRAGDLDSPVMPLAETLAIHGTMDAIRAQWGLKYPME